MKKLVVLMMALAISSAWAAPTFFGQLNKEFRMTSQEDVYKASSFTNVSDVFNSPSRIGFKGLYETGEIKGSYKFEIGIQSTTDTLPLRLAQGSIDHAKFGSLIFGKTYAATQLVGIMLDPLAGTGVGLIGADQGAIEGASTYIGFKGGSRDELFGYVSPKFAGAQVSVTVDRDDNATMTATPRPATNYEVMAKYSGEFGTIKPTVYVGYIKSAGESKAFDTIMKIGAKIGFNAFSVTGMYTTEGMDKVTGVRVKDLENTYMMGTFAYQVNNKNKVAFTYGKKEMNSGILGTDADENSLCQMAVGYLYTLHKNIILSATFAQLENEEKDSTLTVATGHENKSTIFGLGAKLTF